MRALYLPVRAAGEFNKKLEAGPYLSKVVDKPVCGADEVVIHVKACNLTLWDQVQVRSMIKQGFSELSIGQGFSGVVDSVGSQTTLWRVGEEVMGVVPMDSNRPACADYVSVSQYDVVGKPTSVSHAHAASCIEDVMKAYTALLYLGRLRSADTVFVARGATGFGSMCVQLACHYGARVITSSHSVDEKSYLETLELDIVIVDLEQGTSCDKLKELLMEETLQTGVDIIVDQSNSKQPVGEDAEELSTPSGFLTAHECSLCLAVGGRYITQQCNLQLDPDVSQRLLLKCASLCFLFAQSWQLGCSELGRFQHILLDAAEKLDQGVIRPNLHHTVNFSGVTEGLEHLNPVQIGNTVSVMD